MKQAKLMAQRNIQIKNKTMVKFRHDWPICMMTAVIVFAMNHFCRTNDSDTLKWILTPTAWWAGILGRIYFEYLPHQGYVNYFHQFLIAPSCAGCRFMLIVFLMLAFSFRFSDFMCGSRKEYLWFGFSIGFSYISTIFVNGIRIVISVYLPDIMGRMHLMDGWLTSDRLHTLIGTITYFTFLCVIYWIASLVYRRIFSQTERNAFSSLASGMPEYPIECGRLFSPVFWYILVVLALPFIKRMYHHEWEGFGQYAAVIVVVCGCVCMLFMVARRIGQGLQRRIERAKDDKDMQKHLWLKNIPPHAK